MMEKNREDMVNKRITNQTLERQKEISVKLLEAEKAELKQDFDENWKFQLGDVFAARNPEYNDSAEDIHSGFRIKIEK